MPRTDEMLENVSTTTRAAAEAFKAKKEESTAVKVAETAGGVVAGLAVAFGTAFVITAGVRLARRVLPEEAKLVLPAADVSE